MAGMHLPWGKIAIGGLVAIAAFGGAIWASQWLWPSTKERRPALVEVPPLAPLARNSVIVTPASIALTAIRDVLEAAAPRNLAGKRDNVLPQVLSNAEISWTVARGPLAVAGRPEGLTVSTALTGNVQTTGEVAGDSGNLVGALGGLLGGRLGQQVQNLQGKSIDQRTELRGNVTVRSRPALLAAWRVEPNLAAEVALPDASLAVLGVRPNVATAASTSRWRRCRRGCATIRSWSWRQSANGQRCAARSRSAALPACPIFGSSSARHGPLPRSHASPRRRSSSPSACRRKRASCPTRPSRTVRSRHSWSSSRRPSRVASISPCRSIFHSPR